MTDTTMQPSRPGLALALAGVALAGMALGAGLFARYGARAAPDPGRVAVAPFDVYVPGLEGWRAGLARALSERLDTTGALSAVPQAVVARRWRARDNPIVAAVELARRAGAGLAVYGRLDPAADSVRIRVAVADADHVRVLFEAEVRAPQALPAAADALAARILEGLGLTPEPRP